MSELDFKRKIYQQMLAWKEKRIRKALVIEGLRQIGKSYIVERFAKENYENVYAFDFRKYESHRKMFAGSFDLKAFKEDLFILFNKKYDDHNAVLIFDEIGDSPDARAAIKYILKETNFDIIATGSLLAVKGFKQKKDRSPGVGSCHFIKMFPLDFEEFLWANGVGDGLINEIKEGLTNLSPIRDSHHEYLNKMFKYYMLCGGMPEAVKKFVETHDFNEVIDTNIDKLKELEGDFGRIIGKDGKVQIDEELLLRTRQVYDSLVPQLAKSNTKFMFSYVRKGGRAKEYEEAITWLENAGIIAKCHNLIDLSRPLEGNIDPECYKLYFSDIGLYVAKMGKQVASMILKGEIDSYGGYIYEGVVADILNKAKMPLCYSDNHKAELDFIIEDGSKIAILEAKQADGQSKSARATIEGKSNRHADICYKIRGKNFGLGSYYSGLPHYALPFLLNRINEDIENTLKIDEAVIPED